MKKALWIAGIILIALFGWIAWQFVRTPGIQLKFLGYDEEKGKRFATLSLENISSQSVFCEGSASVPFVHFRTLLPEGEMMGGGAGLSSGGITLSPGQRIQFKTRLLIYPHHHEVMPPFKAAVKVATPARMRLFALSGILRIPYNWRPTMGVLVWSNPIEE